MAQDQDWDKALAKGPGPVRATAETYTLWAYEDINGRQILSDQRAGISWASVCGILGNGAEGDIAFAHVKRDRDGRTVLKYSAEGVKK